jgi:hypothetical protein
VQFGRDLNRRADKPWMDAASIELLPLSLLRRETAAAGLASHQAEAKDRPDRLLAYHSLSLEVARRTGEAEPLTRAASAAERAARLATSPAVIAAARVAQAHAALAAGVLFSDPNAADGAASWIATPEVAATPGVAAAAMAIRARVEASRALAGFDLDQAILAGSVLDAAVERLDAQAGDMMRDRVQAAAMRRDRAEFLIAFGTRLKDRALIVQAEADLRQLSARLDPDYLPLSWARTEALRGVALAALGDLDGDIRALTESVTTLAAAAEQADFDYSPLDRARICHAMGLGLQVEETAYDHALSAFDQALVALAPVPALPLRAMVIYDRAGCVASRAERRGDLARAEAEFKAELARRGAAADPVAWAVAQLALSRVYEARAELVGDEAPPPETAIALTEAFEVFTEQGLKTLAEAADAGLAKFRKAAERS